MSDTNAGRSQASQGSLVGFQSFTSPGGTPDIVKQGWSREEMRRFLSNESGTNFPSETQLSQISQLISEHLNDHGNPHQVTLDQLDKDFILEVLGSMTPGTPPNLPPFFAYEAAYALPLGNLYPATYTTTNFYRLNEGGIFTNPASEPEVFGTDYLNNVPGIALFNGATNVVPSGWATAAGLLTNTVMANATARPGFPFTFYMLSETNATGNFGLALPVSESLSTAYTLSIFLAPTVTGGSVVLSQPSDPTKKMTVNLTDGSYTCSSADISGETVVYPSGIIKVSFSFVSKAPTADNAVNIHHLNTGDTATNRGGQAARPLFYLSYPIVTTASLNQPIPVNNTLAASTSTFALALDKIPTPVTMTHLMIAVSFNLYPMLGTGALADNKLFTFGNLTIERDRVNVYVKLAGVTLFTSAILNGLNAFTISYSPTTIIFKDLAAARQTATGSYSSLSTAIVSAGPCAGYLQNLAIYAQADTAKCVEYLTNG